MGGIGAGIWLWLKCAHHVQTWNRFMCDILPIYYSLIVIWSNLISFRFSRKSERERERNGVPNGAKSFFMSIMCVMLSRAMPQSKPRCVYWFILNYFPSQNIYSIDNSIIVHSIVFSFFLSFVWFLVKFVNVHPFWRIIVKFLSIIWAVIRACATRYPLINIGKKNAQYRIMTFHFSLPCLASSLIYLSLTMFIVVFLHSPYMPRHTLAHTHAHIPKHLKIPTHTPAQWVSEMEWNGTQKLKINKNNSNSNHNRNTNAGKVHV